jgi:hypothetical protein
MQNYKPYRPKCYLAKRDNWQEEVFSFSLTVVLPQPRSNPQYVIIQSLSFLMIAKTLVTVKILVSPKHLLNLMIAKLKTPLSLIQQVGPLML